MKAFISNIKLFSKFSPIGDAKLHQVIVKI